jgi:hypothetical protein
MPMMVTPSAQSRFRSDLAQGRRPRLSRADLVFAEGAANEVTDELRRALRAKYKTQGAAMAALGLDANLLKQERPMAPRERDDDDDGVLSPNVKKGLDALSPMARDAVRKYLSRDVDPDDDENGGRMMMDQQEPSSMLPSALSAGTGMAAPGSQDEEQDDDKLTRLCGILSELGVSDDKISQLREMLANGGGDGDLLLRHKANGDERLWGTTKDGNIYSMGPTTPGSEPPAFSGSPRRGGGQSPVARSGSGSGYGMGSVDRRVAMDQVLRGKYVDDAGIVRLARNAPRPRKRIAMDENSMRERGNSWANFAWRWPEAARIKNLG